MAEAKKKADDAPAGAAELQKRADAELDKGYVGNKVDPRPNSAHSLESGPEAPPVHEQVVQTDATALEGDSNA